MTKYDQNQNTIVVNQHIQITYNRDVHYILRTLVPLANCQTCWLYLLAALRVRFAKREYARVVLSSVAHKRFCGVSTACSCRQHRAHSASSLHWMQESWSYSSNSSAGPQKKILSSKWSLQLCNVQTDWSACFFIGGSPSSARSTISRSTGSTRHNCVWSLPAHTQPTLYSFICIHLFIKYNKRIWQC